MARDRFLNPASLRVFAVVARRGSLVAAADELHVTHGAISKQIHALEQELGTRLFERRNRGLHLTAGGRWLSERLGPLFADMERIIADFRALDDRGGPLTISCEPTLCLRLLIPLTAALRQETGLDIRVLSAGGTVDFKRDHIDAAIRRSDFVLPPDVRATPLAPEWMGPVLAPSLAGAALAECPILISDTRPDAWRAWARDSNVHLAGATVRYEHFYLALQAAEAGQGLAMASVHMVAAELRSGRLYAPWGFTADGSDYLLLRPDHAADERIDRLARWLAPLMQTHRQLAQPASQ